MSKALTDRGILLALDLSPESRATTELAVEVAAALGAGIEGLFVEDRELLELAGHPLAREVDLYGAGTKPLERDRLERGLRAQAARARSLLANVAERRGIAWTFRVVRGTVLDEIRVASREAMAITVGRVGWSRGPGRALGRTTQGLLIEGEQRVLLPGRLPVAKGPVVACYEGSPAGRRVLDAAARLARGSRTPLRVELVARDEASLARLRQEAAARLADADVGAAFHDQVARPASELIASLRTGPCGFLVMPAGVLGEGSDLVSLVSDLDCPLLLIR